MIYYCGCCGGTCPETKIFCSKCEDAPGHLGPPNDRPWERTYLAVHKTRCPFDAFVARVRREQE